MQKAKVGAEVSRVPRINYKISRTVNIDASAEVDVISKLQGVVGV